MTLIGRRIIRRERVVSTMDETDALAAAGEGEGVVVVADEQTAGRGRAGRSWQAPAGASILCSILIRPALPPGRLTPLPLLIGVAVAGAIESVAPVRCRLKWPNDVWIDGQKVAGILMTSRTTGRSLAHVTIGIGINVNVGISDLPAGATSLLAQIGQVVDREVLLNALLERCDALYGEFREREGRLSLDPWRAMAALMGESVQVQQGDELITGILHGVTDDGALLISQEQREPLHILAGDLTRGPKPF